MKPFLKLFGVEEGNGLSPFLNEINEPSDLLALVNDFFRRPKRDPREMGQQPVAGIGGDSEELDEEEEEDEEEQDKESEQGDFVPSFMDDIASVDVTGEGEDDEDTASVANNAVNADAGAANNDGDDIASYFDSGDGSAAYLELKALLSSEHIPSIGSRVLKIMQLLQLGKIEKGSLLPDGKYTSLNARWFGCKKKKATTEEPSDDDEANGGLYIERDCIVTMKCKRGKSESVASYRVLAIFSKHYNKWYVHWDSDRVLFEPGSKKYKVLARMVEKNGSNYSEVELEKGGAWGPRAVYRIKHMSEIESVEEGTLASGFSF
ncbi:hypothetical protein ACHAXT_006982 [Thalassiosira profunda]